MKHRTPAVASLAFALVHPSSAASGRAGCDTGSWIGGSTEICDGVFVYHDYVYDDYGATAGDPNAGSTGTLSRTDGNVRYTADINSADLVALRLSISGGQLHVSFELNTLRDPNSTVAALEIDTSDQRGACLAGDPISCEITTDGPVQFAFSDGSVLSFPSAGTYTGTLPEPGPLASLAAGAALIVALGRRRAS